MGRMPRSRLTVALVVIAACGVQGSLLAQAAPGAGNALPDEPNWKAVCSQALKLSLPETAAHLDERVAPPPASILAKTYAFPVDGCDESAAYYGYGEPAGSPDYEGALTCGYLQRKYPEQSAGDPFQGPGVLSMLYANGYGVTRDYALAIRFSCENTWAADAEMEERIGRLEALQAGRLKNAKPFDLCDDATSGLMGGACELVQQKQADVGRTRRLAALRAQLPPRAQAMLPSLQAAETAFEQTRKKREYAGGGGTGAAGFVLEDQGQLREQFVINLERFARGNVPRASGIDRRQADAALARAYAAVQAAPVAPYPGAVQPQGVAATQQAWRALFAAWMQFVPVAYPGLSAEAAAVELDRLRMHQLQKLTPAN